MNNFKQCITCKNNKLLDNFHKNTKSKDGRQSKCKKCANEYAIKYRKLPGQKEKRKEYDITYYEDNKETILKRKNKHYEENKEYKLEWQHNYYKWHKEKIKIYNNEYYEDNKEELLKYQNEYYMDNKEERNEYNKSYNKERYANDLNFKLRRIMSASVAQMLRAKGTSKEGRSVLEFLPYTVEELKSHIENLFEPWMTWDNHGKYNPNTWNDNDASTWTWNIDYIKPHSTFKYKTMDC